MKLFQSKFEKLKELFESLSDEEKENFKNELVGSSTADDDKGDANNTEKTNEEHNGEEIEEQSKNNEENSNSPDVNQDSESIEENEQNSEINEEQPTEETVEQEEVVEDNSAEIIKELTDRISVLEESTKKFEELANKFEEYMQEISNKFGLEQQDNGYSQTRSDSEMTYGELKRALLSGRN